MLICLAAMMSLAVACGDDNGNGDDNNVNNGNDVGADAGDDSGPDEDTGDDAGDDADPNPDADPGGDDLTGFEDAGGEEIDESNNGWSLFTSNAAGDQFLSLELAADGGASDTGTFEFEDFASAEPANVLVMADGCTDQGCEAIFQAVSGTLEITTFEKTEGGSFEATLTDVELVEVEFSQTGPSRIADGKTWTIESTNLTAVTDPMDEFAATCDTDGFTAAEGTVEAAAGEGFLIVTAESSADAPRDILSMQIYDDFEGAATTEGTYQLDDFNYATCANCLLLYAGCDEQDQCDATYIAGEGTLEITSTGGVDDQFTATLTGAKLAEVTIDQTYDTELVEDGSGWCIDSFSWDVTITAREQ